MELLLTDAAAFAAFSAHLAHVASRASHTLAICILEHHRAACATRAADDAVATAKNVRVVVQRHGQDLSLLRVLSLPSAASLNPPSFHSWLDDDDFRRRAPPPRGSRLSRLLNAWHLPPSTPLAVVVPERAASRVKSECGSPFRRPSSRLAAGLLHTTVLPVVTANPADHPVLASARRYLSVPELARSFAIPSHSPLHAMLASDQLSPSAAASALGRAVNADVILSLLLAFDAAALAVGRPLRYASAFSGVDVGAVAVDALGVEWDYCFASEESDSLRAALLAAWSSRGLTAATAFQDATSAEATSAPTVDVFLCTPPCEPHSALNRHRTFRTAADALAAVEAALAYVRRARPSLVLVENVDETWLIESLTGLVLDIPGYTWFGGILDPLTLCGLPTTRSRFFWVGCRAS